MSDEKKMIAPLTLTDLDELERLEREATGGPWVDGYVSGFCQKKHGPDEKGPWHGNGFCQYEYSVTKTDDAHRLASTSAIKEVAGNYDYEDGGIINPEDHALIVAARNNLPQLLALAKIGVLAVAEREAHLRYMAAEGCSCDADGCGCDEGRYWQEVQDCEALMYAAIDAYKGGLPK